MGLLSAITGLFGSSKTVDKIATTAADGIYHGLDKLVYTDEKKADALAKGRETFLKFIDKAYDQNTTRSITRRWLAFLVVGPAMLIFMTSAIAYPFSQPLADHLFLLFKDIVPWAGGVLIFYFGPHLISAGKS